MSLVSVVCCQVEVSTKSWSFVQRSPTEIGVSEYDHDALIMRRPCPTGGCCTICWGRGAGNIQYNFFSSATTCPLRLRGLPPPGLWLKCNRLLKLRRPVGAVTLSRWEWWWNERWIWGARGGALNLISTNYPTMVTMGVFPFQGKTHIVEPVIEPGTSWLVVRSSDHQATRLVVQYKVVIRNV